MLNEMIRCWDLPEVADFDVPKVSQREIRTVQCEGQTFVSLCDLARCLNIDRKRLVRSLRGRARLVDTIDTDGQERFFLGVTGEDLIAASGSRPDAVTLGGI